MPDQISAGRPRARAKVDLESRPPSARALLLARLRAGLTQADAACRVGISGYWLSQIELGHERPSETLVARLLALYGGDE